MADINTVVIGGRLTKDIELKYTTGAEPTAIASFSIANNRGWGDHKKTYFINCIAFGKQAENMEQLVKKGDGLTIVGEWQTGNYKDKNGNTVYTNNLKVNEFTRMPKTNNITLEVREESTDPVPTGFKELDADIPF